MTPAEYVIHVFGGVNSAARAVGYSGAAVCKWQKSREWRGSKGVVPQRSQEKVLRAAQRMRLDLTRNDLIYGRDISLQKKA